jgi:hypothetical protein
MIPTATLCRIWELEEQTSPDSHGAAVISADGTRRYLLARRWADGPLMAWLMLNPSTADAVTDDATIKRCVKRARQLPGFGGIAVVNLFSLRATDPRELAKHPDPVGPANDVFIRRTCAAAGLVVAAWGAHGTHLDRGREVTELLGRCGIEPFCLGITATAQPRHPGRMAYPAALRRFEAGEAT